MFLKRKKKKQEKEYDLDVRITAMVKEDGKLQFGMKTRYLGINDTDHRQHPIFLEIEKLYEMVCDDLGVKTKEKRDRLRDNSSSTIGP